MTPQVPLVQAAVEPGAVAGGQVEHAPPEAPHAAAAVPDLQTPSAQQPAQVISLQTKAGLEHALDRRERNTTVGRQFIARLLSRVADALQLTAERSRTPMPSARAFDLGLIRPTGRRSEALPGRAHRREVHPRERSLVPRETGLARPTLRPEQHLGGIDATCGADRGFDRR